MPFKQFTAYGSFPSLQTYPSLPDDITWARLLLGVAYGLSLGFRESTNDSTLRGTIGLIFGLNVVMFLPILYLNLYLKANMDSYKAIHFVGVQNGLAVMMLVWIIFYTMLHEDVEIAFNDALMQSVEKNVVTSDGVDTPEEAFVPVQDSEF